MANYKIKLEPVGAFYFGGERKFNPVEEDRINYLVHSRIFPQQTTLLGMLRYALWRKWVWVERVLDDVALIGKNSFDEGSDSYGVIKNLSPLYIADGEGRLFIEAGLNYQIYEDKESSVDVKTKLELKTLSGEVFSFKENKQEVYYYSNYDAKNYMQHYLTHVNEVDPMDTLLAYDKIFHPYQKPGNQKHRSGKAPDEGFYKQTMYSMERGYSFVIYVETSDDLIIDEKPMMVTMGGDQSEFKMTLQPVKEDEVPFGNLRSSAQKPGIDSDKPVEKGIVTLLSDTYISEPREAAKYYYFAVTEKADFRYMKTVSGTTGNYAALYQRHTQDEKTNKDNKPEMSGKKLLIAKGSVFYCSDVARFVSCLEHSAYRAIGYNYFKITN